MQLIGLGMRSARLLESAVRARATFWLLAALLAIASAGCGRESAGPIEAQTANLPRATIRIGDRSLVVEVAATPEARERGLMYRGRLADDEGMIFIFAVEEPLVFWMKNTLIPLDVGFFDASGRLVNYRTMQPDPEGTLDSDRALYSSTGPALYAVETTAGWFERNRIGRDARLELPENLRGRRGL